MASRAPDLRVEEQIAKRLQESRTYEQIQANLHVGPNIISRVKMAIDARLPPPPTFPRGQPKKMTSDIVQLVKICMTEDRLLRLTNLPGYILATLGVSISQTAVTMIRKLLRFTYASLRNRPVLTDAHIERRTRSCQANVHGDIDWGGSLVVSDASHFILDDDKHRLWPQRGIYTSTTFRDKPKYLESCRV
jgi:transposase